MTRSIFQGGIKPRRSLKKVLARMLVYPTQASLQYTKFTHRKPGRTKMETPKSLLVGLRGFCRSNFLRSFCDLFGDLT